MESNSNMNGMKQEHEHTLDETANEAAVPASAEPALPEIIPEERIAALEAAVAELRDRLLRALAETENVRRRAERDRDEMRKFAIARFAEAIVDVADNLRQALASVAGEGADPRLAALAEGVGLTERALTAAFEQHGIRRFEPLGEPFDPDFHQAILEVEDAARPAGTIVQVLRAGYLLNDRLLRPAMVGIARGGQPALGPVGVQVDTTA